MEGLELCALTQVCGGGFLVVVVGGRCMCMWQWWLYLRGGSGGSLMQLALCGGVFLVAVFLGGGGICMLM